MASRNDAPNIEYERDALAFLATKDVLAQANIFAIASHIYGSPDVDGVNKFLVISGLAMSVRQFLRIYVDDEYLVYYQINRDTDPPLLIIWDIEAAPPTASQPS